MLNGFMGASRALLEFFMLRSPLKTFRLAYKRFAGKGASWAGRPTREALDWGRQRGQWKVGSKRTFTAGVGGVNAVAAIIAMINGDWDLATAIGLMAVLIAIGVWLSGPLPARVLLDIKIKEILEDLEGDPGKHHRPTGASTQLYRVALLALKAEGYVSHEGMWTMKGSAYLQELRSLTRTWLKRNWFPVASLLVIGLVGVGTIVSNLVD